MKIQSPTILAIGLIASLTSAIAGSFAPTGAAIDQARTMRSIVQGRPSATVDRGPVDGGGLSSVERSLIPPDLSRR